MTPQQEEPRKAALADAAHGSLTVSHPTLAETTNDDENWPDENDTWSNASEDEQTPSGTKVAKTEGPSLLDVALACTTLWHSPEGEAWGTIGSQHYPVSSSVFRERLLERYFRRTKKVARAQLLNDALGILAAKASLEGPEHQVHLRVARKGDELWLDLVDKDGRAVRINATGWRVVPSNQVQVKFYRPKGMRPLAVPAPGSNTWALKSALNLTDDKTFRLLLSWLTFALVEDRPYPVLLISGPHGAAKSSFARTIRALIDPNSVAMLGTPRGADFVAHAKNNRVLCFDNVSDVKADLADDLCRLATGGGFGGRRLYTDNDVATFDAKRPVVMNGIPDLATRGDLADRALLVRLTAISQDRRRTETQLQEEFDRVKSQILAGLLDAVVVGLKRLPEIQQRAVPLPRMADFAQWGMAVAPAFGWDEADFFNAYETNRQTAINAVVDDDPLAVAIFGLLRKQPDQAWCGTAEQLLDALAEASPALVKAPGFPRGAPSVGKALSRLEPILAERDVSVERDRTNQTRTITLRMT